MRIGHGYDVHRLVPDRRLILGGVDIPYEKGLLGHSDADVLTHALMDALLGAAALGDGPASGLRQRQGHHGGRTGLHRRGLGHRRPRRGPDRENKITKRQFPHKMNYICAASPLDQHRTAFRLCGVFAQRNQLFMPRMRRIGAV